MFRLLTLGSVELLDHNGREVQSVAAQPRRLALLTYLVVNHPRIPLQRRDTLLALFWPESPEDKARNALNQSVHFLRLALGSETVVSRGEELGIQATAISCDALDFDVARNEGRLSDAIALYRGDFLAGFHIKQASGFEEWASREREARSKDRLASDPLPPARLKTRSVRLAGMALLGGLLLVQSSSAGNQVQPLRNKPNPPLQHTYTQEKADFGNADLVIRISGVELRADTVSTAIRMTNPGGQLVRIGAVRFGLSTDSSGHQSDGDHVSSPFDTATALHQLTPGSDYLMVKTTVSHSLPPFFLGELRCQSPLFYTVRVLLYDSYLRPRTLELPVASLRWNGNGGVVLRSFIYRYYMDTKSTQVEGHSYYPMQVSPLLLGRLTKDALALEMDSTASHCGASERAMKQWSEAWKRSHPG